MEKKYPGLLGMIECDHNGMILQQEGESVEALGNVMQYFKQMSDLIGEAFGMDELEEGHLLGKQSSAVCIPKDNSNLGILFQSGARVDEILPRLFNE